MSGRGCRSLLFYSQEEAIITSAQCAELCRQRLPPVERYSQRVFFGKASFETEHYIRPPGSNNRFHEMLACRSCCVPLSHVYVCVTEGAAFQLFARSLSECPGSMFELCRAWNSNRTEEHAGPTNFSKHNTLWLSCRETRRP